MSPSPNVLLGAAAAVTSRLKIGTAVSVLPLHHPTRLAEEVAELDLLSNGRFQWGIGRGFRSLPGYRRASTASIASRSCSSQFTRGTSVHSRSSS